MYTCKSGHLSDTADCCSVCGGEIVGPAASAAAPTGETCPQCHTAREVGSLFCAVCGYDFVNRPAPSAPPVAVAVAAATSPDPSLAPSPVAAPTASGRWEIRIVQDPQLDIDPDPTTPCPLDPDQSIPLDQPELLLGRAGARRGIVPDISVHDPGVSHQHLRIRFGPDQAVAIEDLNSLNGTEVNGVTIPANDPHPIQAGDVITLGRWTKITLHSA
ncbi:MAG TPA: FHA domain-containing protein [Chloroflexota bacterium]|nr:FHA domain-containing protein [Chloroflexota bacterium]